MIPDLPRISPLLSANLYLLSWRVILLVSHPGSPIDPPPSLLRCPHTLTSDLDLQVLDVLCSLCVCNGVAVRSNQDLITENLLPGRELLLQTNLINYVTRSGPNS